MCFMPVKIYASPTPSISPTDYSCQSPIGKAAADITEHPLTPSGNKYVLILRNYFTKYVKLYPMKDQRAVTEQYVTEHVTCQLMLASHSSPVVFNPVLLDPLGDLSQERSGE